MPVVTYHRPRRARSGDVLLQSPNNSNPNNVIGGSYRMLQTIFVICIGVAAVFVVVLQYQSSEQLVETSIVATLENHDSSPQPTRPPSTVYIRTGGYSDNRNKVEQSNVISTNKQSFLKIPYYGPQQTYTNRLDRYCARHIPSGENAESFSSKIAEQFGLELTNLVITIRHGDRSAIHSLPNSTIAAPKQLFVEPKVKDFLPFLQNLQLNILSEENAKSNFKKHPGEDLSHAIDPTTVFQQSDFTLPQGQLTSRGFAQHLELGQSLYRAYGASYLQHVALSEHVYVRSTNYVRTIQSVSALLMSLLPHILQKKTLNSKSSTNSNDNKITIHTYANEDQEIMHGVGVRSSSHGISIPGQPSVESLGTCPQAVVATKSERKHFVVTTSAVATVADIFGPAVHALYPPEIVDTTIPAYCHLRPLPCATTTNSAQKQSPASCFQQRHLEHLMKDADRYYCDRYSGVHGGYEATKLATYPFLHEIKEALLKDSTTDNNAKKTAQKPLTIFSGHDTVIAPVLASLGVFRTMPGNNNNNGHNNGPNNGQHAKPSLYCNWPGYASRIVFERYSDSSNVHTNNNKNSGKTKLNAKEDDIATVIAAAKTYWESQHSARTVLSQSLSSLSETGLLQFLQTLFNNKVHANSNLNAKTHTQAHDGGLQWVRVLFNGDDITQMIPACVAERWILAHIVSQYLPLSAGSSNKNNSNRNNTTTNGSRKAGALVDFLQTHSAEIVSLARRFYTTSTVETNNNSNTAGSNDNDDKVRFTLCSAQAFAQQVQDLIAPATTLSEACQLKSIATSTTSTNRNNSNVPAAK